MAPGKRFIHFRRLYVSFILSRPKDRLRISHQKAEKSKTDSSRIDSYGIARYKPLLLKSFYPVRYTPGEDRPVVSEEGKKRNYIRGTRREKILIHFYVCKPNSL
jgi:hypothetical protein